MKTALVLALIVATCLAFPDHPGGHGRDHEGDEGLTHEKHDEKENDNQANTQGPVKEEVSFEVFFRAEAHMVPAVRSSKIKGQVDFFETAFGVSLIGDVFNLKPGKHAIAIHEKGSVENACKDAGRRFNPARQKHGAPQSGRRQAADLGNVEPDVGTNHTLVNVLDNIISLNPKHPYNILGKTLVIYEEEDKFTKEPSGPRITCGIIKSVPVDKELRN